MTAALVLEQPDHLNPDRIGGARNDECRRAEGAASPRTRPDHPWTTAKTVMEPIPVLLDKKKRNRTTTTDL